MMTASISHIGIVGSIMKKDLTEFTRDRLWALLSGLGLVFYVGIFWLLPNTVNETITVGIRQTGMDIALQGMMEIEEDGLEVVLFRSTDRLKAAVAGEIETERSVRIGIDFSDDFLTKTLRHEKTIVQVYVDAGVPREISRAVSSMVREIALMISGDGLPVTEPDGQTVLLGEDRAGNQVPFRDKMRPMLAFFILMVEAFALASLIATEVQAKTVTAVLVTPVKLSEVLAAKAGLGFILAVLMAYTTLLLNGALGAHPAAILVALLVAALMSVELGLIYGTTAKDAKTLFTLMKTLNIFLFAPVIFYVFPDWPQWMAKVFPTYWLINPIFEIAIKNAGLADVGNELGIAIGICGLLIIPVVALKRRMQAHLSLG